MIVLEPQPVETYLSALSFFGLRLEWFIIILLVVGSFLFFAGFQWWQNRKRRINLADVEGRVLIESLPPTGSVPVKRVLCKEENGEVTIEYTNPKTKEVKKVVHGLLPEHEYLDYWPYNVPKAQQVSVRKYYFRFNEYTPEIPHNAKEWDSKRYTDVTATMSQMGREESVTRAALQEFSGVFKQLEGMAEKFKYITLTFFAVIGCILLSGAAAFLAFRNTQVMGDVLTLISKFVLGK